jgi:DNA mismatch repair protein MutL
MPIRLLPDQLASQIAAGEVVERPISVVKELIENALDAQATVIYVDIKEGGRTAIQIADNGLGIPAGEVELAFLRHATSKVEKVEDLEAIQTLGFRGEALAAIAAVSQVTVITRIKSDPAGVRLSLEGGKKVALDQVGAPVGTVISVENLFYNVPARLKFLKTAVAERRLIDELIANYALAYPQVRFRLTHDGRVLFQSSGNGQLADCLVAVYGAETARELLPVTNEQADPQYSAPSTQNSALTITGYTSPPHLHRANRSQMTIFVNGRWVKDKNLTYAILQAYHTLLPTGRYPIALLFVNLPLELVDVNVHPTKSEVRFRDPNRVFGAVQKAVRETILAQAPVRSAGVFATLTPAAGSWGGGQDNFRSFTRPEEETDSSEHWAWTPEPTPQNSFNLHRPPSLIPQPPASQPTPAAPIRSEKLPIMRVIGQVGSSYIITEGPEGMFLVDQHAAHERILYEQFLQAHQLKAIVSQGLVAGTTIQLPPDQTALLEEQLPLLAELGFTIEPFGPQIFMIRAIPAFIAHQDPLRIVGDVVSDLERGDTPAEQKVKDKILRRVCKSAAIKAGQTLARPEMEQLIEQLGSCENPHTCPHGRPTLIYLSVSQLARQFGRS